MINQRFTKLQLAAMGLFVINCIWLIHYGTRTQPPSAPAPSTDAAAMKFFSKKHEEGIANQVLENMNFDQLTERLHSIEKKLSQFQNQPPAPECASSSTCPKPPTPSSCPASLTQAPVAQRWPKEGLPLKADQVRTFLQAVYKAKKSNSILPNDTWFSEDPNTAKIAEDRLTQEFNQPAGVPEISVWSQIEIPPAGDFNIESPVSLFPVEKPFPGSQGFIFIVGSAFGQKGETFLYLKELIFACASIKNKSPGSNITLIATPTIIQKLNQAFGKTQVKFQKPLIDFVFDFYKLVQVVGRPMREEILRRTRYLPWPHGGYIIKTIGMLLTPYEKTIFLDTDIYFCEKPDPIFTVLDRFDAAAADDVFRHWGSTLTPGFPASARSVMYDINGGLLAYKWNGYVTKWLIDTVEEFHSTHYPGMQGVLSGLIWAEEDLNFWLLGKEWNCHLIKTHCGDKWGEPKYAIPCRMLHAHSLVDDKDPPEDPKDWKTFAMPDVRRIMYAIM
eukprot:TRINITY_DN2084_c0_g1_i1.p1 TRINITY_DN2084_c0_g1~~TRINITY_DN2084_c0_g1_i1.p1  ORF type:complete len:502 (-),score=82.57 TRINITY_DN2084_c0_g1_i1:49-1554(-)